MDELIEAMAAQIRADCAAQTRLMSLAAARACFTALQSKGWVVVPVEPTEEMVLAADRMGFRAPRNFWNEMLLASPMNDLLRAQTRSTKADRSAG